MGEDERLKKQAKNDDDGDESKAINVMIGNIYVIGC